MNKFKVPKNFIVLIPARSGSKRLKNKNLQTLGKKTLVEISINQAQQSSYTTDIFVSSDSETILNLAQNLGATAVCRDTKLSEDSTSSNEVVKHFISWAYKNVKSFDSNTIIVYLQPTSPFRPKNFIDKCLEIFIGNLNPLVVVSQVKEHPYKMLTLDTDNTLYSDNPSVNPTSNFQELQKFFIPTGSIYIFSVANFEIAGQIPIFGATPYIVDGIMALDIDDEMDLEISRHFWDRG